jgi:uncharacterized membrane protein/protein-disulfide isomerase
MSSRALIVAVLISALLGFGFAAAATYDFAAHLDRQVHNLHCSFIPGLSSSSPAGSEGCQLTLMSPYSSLLRSSLWGGIPVSLLALAVFTAIAVTAGIILMLRAEEDSMALFGLLILASIPVGASLVMGSIAAFKLHAACKQCIGIYICSALVGAGAFWAYRRSTRYERGLPLNMRSAWLLPLPLLAALIIVLLSSYALAMPSYKEFSEGCGKLVDMEDRHNVLVHLPASDESTRDTPHSAHNALEIFDPLCPACKAFEERLTAASFDKHMARDLLLFPLDNSCNWMVDNAMHPGSCDVSLAVLCAGDHAQQVIDWAFAEQRTIQQETARDKHAAERMVIKQFPKLQACMKSATTKARLSQSLRWAVRNQVPVLTPQFYVNGKRLCDEDTDLGLEYTLSRMLQEDGT